MKTALVRIVTMATLASSILAFAADQPKSNDPTMVAANTQQEGCATGQNEKKQKKAKSQRDDRTEQEKEFDHTLMGTLDKR